MTGLNSEELDAFFKECDEEYEEDTKFLVDHGWKKKNNSKDCNIWISPKGEEFSHHLGFFGEETTAINKAKHDIVLEQFLQFQVQIFNDKERPKNKRNLEEPIDFFFPCIKDDKLYSYIEAVEIACYNNVLIYNWDRWIKLKTVLQKLDLEKIKQNDIVKVYEFWDNETSSYGFKI